MLLWDALYGWLCHHGTVRYNLDIISTTEMSSALCLLCRSLFLLFNVMCTHNNMTTSVSIHIKCLRHIGCQQIIVPSESEDEGRRFVVSFLEIKVFTRTYLQYTLYLQELIFIIDFTV